MSFSPRRLIGPTCGFLLLMPCAVARAADAPVVGVRLPSAGFLEQHDPRLAKPVAPAPSVDADPTPVADDPQGPPATSQPASSTGADKTAGALRAEDNPESKQTLHRRPASANNIRPTADSPNELAGSWSFRDALPLAVVLALIAGLTLVVKKYMPVRKMLTGAGAMDIVARLPVSAKQSLLLVKMGSKLVLIGVSQEQMASLAVVDDADQVATIMGQVASRRPDSISHSFADDLGDEAHAYAEEPQDHDQASLAGGCVRGLLDKVRGLTRSQEMA